MLAACGLARLNKDEFTAVATMRLRAESLLAHKR